MDSCHPPHSLARGEPGGARLKGAIRTFLFLSATNLSFSMPAVQGTRGSRPPPDPSVAVALFSCLALLLLVFPRRLFLLLCSSLPSFVLSVCCRGLFCCLALLLSVSFCGSFAVVFCAPSFFFAGRYPVGKQMHE